MKKYVVNANGEMKKFEGVFDRTGQMINKNVDVLSGNGSWKNWYGFNLFVDDSGTIIKGMEPFIGRNFNDISKLNQMEGLTVFNSINNVLNATQKSLAAENLKTYNENMEKINDYLNTTIARHKMS